MLTRASFDVPKDQQALLYEAFTAADELGIVALDDPAFADLLAELLQPTQIDLRLEAEYASGTMP